MPYHHFRKQLNTKFCLIWIVDIHVHTSSKMPFLKTCRSIVDVNRSGIVYGHSKEDVRTSTSLGLVIRMSNSIFYPIWYQIDVWSPFGKFNVFISKTAAMQWTPVVPIWTFSRTYKSFLLKNSWRGQNVSSIIISWDDLQSWFWFKTVSWKPDPKIVGVERSPSLDCY